MKHLRGVALAATVTVVSSAAVAKATRKLRRNYFPLADEWPILAHSHPRVAQPRTWVTEGFRNYFAPPEGLPNPQGAIFSRPLFNATYWAVGHAVEPESSRYLHISHAGIGACAGMTAFAISQAGGNLRTAAASGAAMPFMPALIPSWTLLIYPCMAFDPLAACMSQSATMAFERGHIRMASTLLTAGLLTKETVLPTASALTGLHVLQQHGRLLRDPGARRDLAALVAPIGLWWAIRRAVFSDVTIKESAYVLRDDPRGRLIRQARIASKFPFWSNFGALRDPGLTAPKVASAAKLLANGLTMGGAGITIGSRLRDGHLPTADETSFLTSYAFLSAVGKTPRYGVTLDMSLLISLARWRIEGRQTNATRAVTLGIALGLLADAIVLAREYPRVERNFLAYAEVGRKYVAALRRFESGERVLVLNDPVTFWAPVTWMTRALGIRAEVIKLADYPYSRDHLDGIAMASTVRLEAPETPEGPWRFSQSGGLDVLSSFPLLAADQATHLDYGDGISIDLEPTSADDQPTIDHRRWASMRIVTGDRPAHLLYYDPAVGEFKTVLSTSAEGSR